MITALTQTRHSTFGGTLLVVRATSDLAGTVYYHWYLDGVWIGATVSSTRTLFVAEDEQVRVAVHDTTDPNFDGLAAAPTAGPRRRTIWWVRSLASDVAVYRVDQRVDAGEWTAVARVAADPAAWTYQVQTGVLTDLAEHEWRVVPLDAAGNEGTPLALDAEKVVRLPDAPDWTAAFDDETQKVTFAAA